MLIQWGVGDIDEIQLGGDALRLRPGSEELLTEGVHPFDGEGVESFKLFMRHLIRLRNATS